MNDEEYLTISIQMKKIYLSVSIDETLHVKIYAMITYILYLHWWKLDIKDSIWDILSWLTKFMVEIEKATVGSLRLLPFMNKFSIFSWLTKFIVEIEKTTIGSLRLPPFMDKFSIFSWLTEFIVEIKKLQSEVCDFLHSWINSLFYHD